MWENQSDSRVYLALLFLLLLCGGIVGLNIFVTMDSQSDSVSSSTFRPLQRQVNSRFK